MTGIRFEMFILTHIINQVVGEGVCPYSHAEAAQQAAAAAAKIETVETRKVRVHTVPSSGDEEATPRAAKKFRSTRYNNNNNNNKT